VVAGVTDADYMARALFHAARGRGRTSPNPLVGAVVVSADGVVVGQGFHEKAGEPHAEIHALNAAGGRARGATLYCTLEPCSHTGRTGPCVERIVDAGVARVVAAIEDPNPLVSGRGFAYLKSHGVGVDVGVESSRARLLNQPFLTLMRERRPFVILKAAVSLDGYIAEAPGRRTGLTSAAANFHAHRIRAEVDAVGVGSGTVLVDDPLLTPRGPYRSRPLTRVIFDRRLRTPPTAQVLSTLDAGPVMIVTTVEAAADAARREPLERAGAQIVPSPDASLTGALRLLGERAISSLLLEGGAALHAAAWDEGVADFIRLYVAPRTLGPGGVAFLADRGFSSTGLVESRRELLGPDVMVEGYVHGPR
jgi:diaminohydroxyphosphoribosylaminopyrimidine deaminase/5-amino-6-(5-phosphoribosylamino)uracil reductase